MQLLHLQEILTASAGGSQEWEHHRSGQVDLTRGH
jgi:hypothetical protein